METTIRRENFTDIKDFSIEYTSDEESLCEKTYEPSDVTCWCFMKNCAYLSCATVISFLLCVYFLPLVLMLFCMIANVTYVKIENLSLTFTNILTLCGIFYMYIPFTLLIFGMLKKYCRLKF